MLQPRGTWYIVPTPFRDDDGVDTDSLHRLTDAAVRWGVDGLTILGVMGEVAALSDTERSIVAGTVLGAVAGRVPVAVGCSAPSVRGCLDRIAEAAELGAAAVMVSAPPLVRDTDQVVRFFHRIGEVAALPVIVQDEPVATDVRLPVSALLAAMRACGSRVVKLEDPPTPPKISRLLAQDGDVTVFGGLGGVSAFHELARGSAGTMTGFAYPEVLKAVREAFEAGDRKRAAAIFDRYLPLICFEGQPVAGLGIRKEVLRRRGVLATGRTRGLSPTLDAQTLAELDEVLERVRITPSPEPLAVMS